MRSDLHQVALSIRQPWAWAILHAGKDIESGECVTDWGHKPIAEVQDYARAAISEISSITGGGE